MTNLYKLFVFTVVSLLTVNSLTAQNKNTEGNAPKLIVVLSIDQMRTDYLTRYCINFNPVDSKDWLMKEPYFQMLNSICISKK